MIMKYARPLAQSETLFSNVNNIPCTIPEDLKKLHNDVVRENNRDINILNPICMYPSSIPPTPAHERNTSSNVHKHNPYF